MKNKLLASSSSIEGITTLIKEYFFSPNITLQYNKDHWDIYNTKGLIENFEIIKTKKRYKFYNLKLDK